MALPAEYTVHLHIVSGSAGSHGTIAGGDQSSSSAYLTSLRREAVKSATMQCVSMGLRASTLTDHDIRKLMHTNRTCAYNENRK